MPTISIAKNQPTSSYFSFVYFFLSTLSTQRSNSRQESIFSASSLLCLLCRAICSKLQHAWWLVWCLKSNRCWGTSDNSSIRKHCFRTSIASQSVSPRFHFRKLTWDAWVQTSKESRQLISWVLCLISTFQMCLSQNLCFLSGMNSKMTLLL